MRSPAYIGVLLLALALSACGTTDAEPTARLVPGGRNLPPVGQQPPVTVALTPDPGTGALDLHDIEDAVHIQAAADLVSDRTHISHVQCLTEASPLVYPATADCTVAVDLPDHGARLSHAYSVTLTDHEGHIAIKRGY